MSHFVEKYIQLIDRLIRHLEVKNKKIIHSNWIFFDIRNIYYTLERCFQTTTTTTRKHKIRINVEDDR